MLKKIYKIISSIVIINSFACGASLLTDLPTFSESDWQSVPTMPEISYDDVCEMFVNPISKEGHSWTIERFNNDDLTRITNDGQFEVRTLLDHDRDDGEEEDDDEAPFHHMPFSVDAHNFVRFELFLVSCTKTYEDESDDDENFAQIVRLPIVRRLTNQEETNSVVAYLRSGLTFEEEANRFRENSQVACREIGLINSLKLRIFMNSKSREEADLELNELIHT